MPLCLSITIDAGPRVSPKGLMPKVANGIHLDADLSRAHSENMELEIHRAVIPKREGILRLLAYVNHANMGSYRQAIDNFRAGLTPPPEHHRPSPAYLDHARLCP